jgi:hypothetical protein
MFAIVISFPYANVPLVLVYSTETDVHEKMILRRTVQSLTIVLMVDSTLFPAWSIGVEAVVGILGGVFASKRWLLQGD